MLRAMVKFLFTTILIALVVLVVGIFVGPKLVPQKTIKNKLAEAAAEKSFELELPGKVSFSLFPDISVYMESAIIKSMEDPELPARNIKNLTLSSDTVDFLNGKLDLTVETILDSKPLEVILRSDHVGEIKAQEGAPVKLKMLQPSTLSIAGNLAVYEGRVNFTDIKLASGRTNGTGVVRVRIDTKVPEISGALNFEELLIDDLVILAAPFSVSESSVDSKGDKVTEVEDLPWGNNLPWKDKEFDFSGLASVAANFNVKAKKLVADKVELADTEIALNLRDAKLEATLVSAKAFGGNITGVVKLDSSTTPYSMSKKFFLQGIDSENFLSTLYDVDKLSGTANIKVDVSGSGMTDLEMVKTLNGIVTLDINNGALNGIDIAAMSSPAAIPQAFASKGKTTVINKMGATLNIRDGLINNNDLIVKIPFTQLDGRGTLDVPSLKLDYRVTPSLGVSRLGLRVPVRFTGDVRNPTILPDLQGLVTQGLDGVAADFLQDQLGITPKTGGKAQNTEELIENNVNNLQQGAGKIIDRQQEKGKISGALGGLLNNLVGNKPAKENIEILDAIQSPNAPAEPSAPLDIPPAP